MIRKILSLFCIIILFIILIPTNIQAESSYSIFPRNGSELEVEKGTFPMTNYVNISSSSGDYWFIYMSLQISEPGWKLKMEVYKKQLWGDDLIYECTTTEVSYSVYFDFSIGDNEAYVRFYIYAPEETDINRAHVGLELGIVEEFWDEYTYYVTAVDPPEIEDPTWEEIDMYVENEDLGIIGPGLTKEFDVYVTNVGGEPVNCDIQYEGDFYNEVLSVKQELDIEKWGIEFVDTITREPIYAISVPEGNGSLTMFTVILIAPDSDDAPFGSVLELKISLVSMRSGRTLTELSFGGDDGIETSSEFTGIDWETIIAFIIIISVFAFVSGMLIKIFRIGRK